MPVVNRTCKHCLTPFSYNYRCGTIRAFCSAECRRVWHMERLREQRKDASRPATNHRMWVSHPCRLCPTILSYEVTSNVFAMPTFCAACRARPRPRLSPVDLSGTCKNGHRRTKSATYINRRGHPDCRLCRSAASLRSRQKRITQQSSITCEGV